MQRAYTELNEELGAEVYTRQVVTIMLRAPFRHTVCQRSEPILTLMFSGTDTKVQ